MKPWEPISLEELNENISKATANMNAAELVLWHYIKIEPEKWQETEYGNEGGGFWAVAVFGRQVLWYNDIEEGFNVSLYPKYGEIGTYACEQNELNTVVCRLHEDIKTGKVFFNIPQSGIIGSDF